MEINYASLGYFFAAMSTIAIAVWRLFKVAHQNDLLDIRMSSVEDRLDKIESKIDILIFKAYDRAD